LFATGGALLDQVQFVWIGAFVTDGGHESLAGAGAVAGGGLVDVFTGKAGGTVVAASAGSGVYLLTA